MNILKKLKAELELVMKKKKKISEFNPKRVMHVVL